MTTLAQFALAAVLMTVASFLAFLGGQALLGSHSTTLAAAGVVRAVVGAGLYLTVVGLLGIGLGFIIRNTAGAIATLFGLLLVLPILGQVLPSSWAKHVVPYLPSNAGQAIMSIHQAPGDLAPWTGFAVFCGYAAAAIIAGVLLNARFLAMGVAYAPSLSGGRLRLGVAVGSRRPDYAAAGVPFERRGQVLDEQLAELRRAWSEPDGFAAPGPPPHTPGGPPILLGGTSRAAVRRVAEHGAGWICGLGGAAAFAQTAEAVRDRWRRAGRDGTPRLLSIVNFALGSGATDISGRFLRRYYGAAPFVESMVADTATTLDDVRAADELAERLRQSALGILRSVPGDDSSVADQAHVDEGKDNASGRSEGGWQHQAESVDPGFDVGHGGTHCSEKREIRRTVGV